MARLLHTRDPSTPTHTFGRYEIEGFTCESIELPELFDGKKNIPQKTCFPPGVYPLRLAYSNKAGHNVIWIDSVPEREACQIHPANKPSELLGCQAPGMKRIEDPPSVQSSRKAFDCLYAILEAAEERGEEMWLEVR